MIGSVRVVLTPISRSTGATLHFVGGARLALSRFGPGKSLATPAAQPATLVFTLGLIKKLRGQPDREDKPLATLSGTLMLKGRAFEPLFTSDGQSALKSDLAPGDSADDDDDDTSVPTVGQTLLLEFDSATFAVPALVKLPMPKIAAGVQHLELQVELRVAGAVESSVKVNDVLDKPVTANRLVVRPILSLDTPVSDAAEHNLAFSAKLPDENIDVQKLTVGGTELSEGETFFQDGQVVFFRPPGKPSDREKVRLLTSDGREFKFELRVAKDVTERLNSLAAQLDNSRSMADAAASLARKNGKTEAEAAAARFDILAQARHARIQLLDSIEGKLDGHRDFGIFFARVATLPTMDDSAAIA